MGARQDGAGDVGFRVGSREGVGDVAGVGAALVVLDQVAVFIVPEDGLAAGLLPDSGLGGGVRALGNAAKMSVWSELIRRMIRYGLSMISHPSDASYSGTTCPERGKATICSERSGKRSTMRCPYLGACCAM